MNDQTPRRIPLLCRLNIRHQWQDELTEDNQRFSRCARCGKDNPRLGNAGTGFGV